MTMTTTFEAAGRPTRRPGLGVRHPGPMTTYVRRALAGLALAVLTVAPLPAQTDTTVVVVAGPRYAAGDLKQRLLGDHYRDLWTLPVRVPVLNLSSYAGGLQVSHRGGGHQTQVLHLRNVDGLEFVFRSVDKSPDLAKEPAFQNTIVSDVVQDQTSSLHPGGAAVVPGLMSAVGVLHPQPTLVMMPDDPALGEFREEFAGVLGWIEQRPDEVAVEGEDERRPGFGGYDRIISTERLLERLEESSANRVDARTYLTARLVDLVMGDWDRHADQWRWAEAERDGISLWIPIPRDRDYAFVDYDGVLLDLARRVVSNAVRFDSDISDLSGLTLNARTLDRRLLTELGLAEWDSVTAFVQGRLTDSVIAEAVSRLPPEYFAASGAELAEKLRGRRDRLVPAARAFYDDLAAAVEVRATDEDDLAVIERVGDDVVEVRLHQRAGGPEGAGAAAYFRRVFYGSETEEVRVFLHGGADSAVVRGAVRSSLTVRVIGGGGDDVMVDSSVVRSGGTPTSFHDDRGDNRMVRGRRTAIDRAPYIPPAEGWSLSGQTFRDWGSSMSIAPVLDYRGTEGPIVGAGPVITRYGFRHHPYRYRIGASARVGLLSWNPAVEVFGDFRRANSPYGHGFRAEASKLENFRFFGFGNDTERAAEDDLYRVRQDQITLKMYVDRRPESGLRLAVGPTIAYTNPDVADGSPIGELPRYGNSGFGQVGGFAEAEVDRRGPSPFPRSGFRLLASADVFSGVWSPAGPFGSVGGSAATYLTPLPVPLTLALRAGVEKAWGDFPVHEAVFLGGSRSLRGYSFQRFAGDASAFGNAELRAPLTEAVLLLRGKLGVLALADAGRVWFDGSSAGDWHTSAGGGVWFEFEIRGSLFGASAYYAVGDENGRFYLSLGAPF